MVRKTEKSWPRAMISERSRAASAAGLGWPKDRGAAI